MLAHMESTNITWDTPIKEEKKKKLTSDNKITETLETYFENWMSSWQQPS